MAKKPIRLQYSGFVLFGAKMLSVATRMMFTLLIMALEREAKKLAHFTWQEIRSRIRSKI